KRLTSVYERGPQSEEYDVKVWSTQTGEKLLALNIGNIKPPLSLGRRLDPSPSLDGRRLVSGRFNREGTEEVIEMDVWDLLTGEKFITIPCNIERTLSGANLTLSQDG